MSRIEIFVSFGVACLVPQLAHAHGGPGEGAVFIGFLVYLFPYFLGLLISGKGNRGVFAKYSLAMFVAVCVLLYCGATQNQSTLAHENQASRFDVGGRVRRLTCTVPRITLNQVCLPPLRRIDCRWRAPTKGYLWRSDAVDPRPYARSKASEGA